MSDEQRRKILDVMHTLSCIRDRKVHNSAISARACWDVLQEVLDLDSPREGIGSK